jgi:threonine dehydrogenase-like Zn-dependent dehydrogenase
MQGKGQPLAAEELDAPAPGDDRDVVVGRCIQPDQVRPTTAVQKELSFQLVLFYRRQDFDLTISKLQRGDVYPEPLITGTIGLDELPERFEALKRPTTERKVLIEP